MATKVDFWGEIGPAEVRTPAAILREQAALLGTKTRNVVVAKVSTQVDGDTFFHSFKLVVPALSGYAYELFTIANGVNPYPVTVAFSPPVKVKTEEEFTTWLKSTLSSTETKKIISNLLAQATS